MAIDIDAISVEYTFLPLLYLEDIKGGNNY